MRTHEVFLKLVLAIFFCLNYSCRDKEDPTGGGSNVIPPISNGPSDFPFSYLGEGTILFSRTSSDGNQSYIYVIDLDQKKTWGYINEGIAGNFKISPDGNTIVQTRGDGLPIEYQIYTCDLFGNNLQKIISMKDQTFGPSWSPDGSTIYFWNLKDGPPENYSLYSTSKTGTGTRKVLDFSDVQAGPVTVSGKDRIAFASNQGSGNEGIYTCKTDGSELERTILPTGEAVLFESPQFSPDGNKLAYLKVWRSDPDFSFIKVNVMLYDVNTKQENTVVSIPAGGNKQWNFTDLGNSVYLAWSPDGTKLLFNVPKADFVSYLYVVDVDGSDLKQVTTASAVEDSRVSWGR